MPPAIVKGAFSSCTRLAANQRFVSILAHHSANVARSVQKPCISSLPSLSQPGAGGGGDCARVG